ncbi:hypothetical protein MKZ38_006481 [Zalerion maritima]|uniref:Uncharacterized protein n=1 Tax=Zalerion maritima TaxID=339359 RepID=A0AAD5RYM7_9PEZI|nr:hypothetical protein MKZ38_006481 [Zalerion maritima]
MSARNSDPLAALYATLELNPTNTHVWEVIVEIWLAQGSPEQARGAAEELLRLAPDNRVALHALELCGDIDNEQASPANAGESNGAHSHGKAYPVSETDLAKRYKQLRESASLLHHEMETLLSISGIPSTDAEASALDNLSSIAAGRVQKATMTVPQPPSARAVARDIICCAHGLPSPSSSSSQPQPTISEPLVDLLVIDLNKTHLYLSSIAHPSPLSEPEIRTRLLSRLSLVRSLLPPSLQPATHFSFLHFDRETLSPGRTYANGETLVMGDPLDTIPRSSFFVTEDNYAWDASELISSVLASDGSMTNPLTKIPLTPSDVKLLLSHPLAASSGLGKSREDQASFREGISPAVAARLKSLGSLLLSDQTEDAAPSRRGVDEFMAFLASRSEEEQKAVDGLRVNAQDRNTGQPFDASIGKSLRDAKGNMTCFHKVGDFLTQAARFLEGSR